MKKLLYISQKPAFPIVDGGSLAVASFLMNLSKIWQGSISYFPITTSKHPFNETKLKEQIANIQCTPLAFNTRISKIGFMLNSFGNVPYNVRRYQDPSIKTQIVESDNLNQFDVVLCDGFYAACIIPNEWFDTKNVIYRAHNVESLIWESKAKYALGLNKLILKNISQRMLAFEHDLLKKFKKILSISETDSKYFKQWNADVATLLPDCEISEDIAIENQNELCFIGDFEWEPNKDAMDHFTQNVFPKIRNSFSDLSLHIAGKNSNQYHNISNGVYAYGFVENAKDFIRSHGIFIAPLRYGSGLNIKVMEALCLGRECILSSISCEGILNQNELCIANEEDDILKALKEILSNDLKRMALKKSALKVAQINFSKDAQIQKMKAIFHD